MFKLKKATSSPVQAIRNVTEYGTIRIIMSPKVKSGLYLRMKARMTPAYAIIGVIIFVDESATR